MTETPLTLVKAWTKARKRLEHAGIDMPVIDARILLLAATGLDRATLISEPHLTLTENSAATFETYVARRAAREPAAHIIGKKGFWTLDLHSDRRALVPRPETEVIVDMVLKTFVMDEPKRVLDLGVGAGTIIMSLLVERPAWSGVGIDVCPDALSLAHENAASLGLLNRLSLQVGHWHQGIEERFDCVVSNPPYIPSADLATLEDEVRLYDPRMALDGGADGLDPYRTLFSALPSLLKPNGIFAFEFGMNQSDPVLAMARTTQGLGNISIIKDLSNIDRVIMGTWHPT
ncbi:peptide chain release factor N(5)-glutamine methyltransferase [Candidatus Phycosocius spiralis]|uniref:Release factor glutamine methyltransferase n=1 Tax=Candidatus Phycosocius spiralis TaxID=2815099 RepID=A0ABQ4PWL8_9PROT|nr:peptide chain release factor N(5)-glutamine methyltransferase [Candidatus Phycosocius spiralis]GIU67390.1 release factor glutamine methyltransferase [Candidatus Phycosocius spiralis]